MLIRLLTIALLTVTVAACSSTKDEAAGDAVTIGDLFPSGIWTMRGNPIHNRRNSPV